jgi:ATP-dependent DNA ligase
MRRRAPAPGIAQPVARGSPTRGPPAWISPQLTQLVDTAPDGDQWLHEIKYDGYRMHARLDRGVVRLPTRTGSTGRTTFSILQSSHFFAS